MHFIILPNHIFQNFDKIANNFSWMAIMVINGDDLVMNRAREDWWWKGPPRASTIQFGCKYTQTTRAALPMTMMVMMVKIINDNVKDNDYNDDVSKQMPPGRTRCRFNVNVRKSNTL